MSTERTAHRTIETDVFQHAVKFATATCDEISSLLHCALEMPSCQENFTEYYGHHRIARCEHGQQSNGIEPEIDEQTDRVDRYKFSRQRATFAIGGGGGSDVDAVFTFSGGGGCFTKPMEVQPEETHALEKRRQALHQRLAIFGIHRDQILVHLDVISVGSSCDKQLLTRSSVYLLVRVVDWLNCGHCLVDVRVVFIRLHVQLPSSQI